jgi:hypothetical protein
VKPQREPGQELPQEELSNITGPFCGETEIEAIRVLCLRSLSKLLAK